MALPDDLHPGASVFSSDGEKQGSLHRVVLRRRDLAVTQVVVDVGFLRSGHKLWEGGLGLEYDRVVPADVVRSATEDRVDLTLSATQFKDAPEYTAESFEPPQDLSPDEFDLPDVVNRAYVAASTIGGVPAFWLVEKLNKSIDDVDIKEGTAVWRQQPHEKLGEVKRLLLDGDGRVRAFVIERGFLIKHDVILPIRYIAELMDDLIRVDIPDADLDRLREHKD